MKPYFGTYFVRETPNENACRLYKDRYSSWFLVVHIQQVALLMILASFLDQLVDALCLESTLRRVSNWEAK